MGAKKGGKGNKGGACAPGEVTLCVSQQLLDDVKASLDGAFKSTGLSDGCLAGLWRVCMDIQTAQQLLATIALGLNVGVTKKKKKKNKNGKGGKGKKGK